MSLFQFKNSLQKPVVGLVLFCASFSALPVAHAQNSSAVPANATLTITQNALPADTLRFAKSNPAQHVTLFTKTSPYHNIRVEDYANLRTLFFDDTMESRMSLTDPFIGGFEYTDYFHMVWLWNPDIKKVLMVGLGGATGQRTFAHYYPGVSIDTAEIDPDVGNTAKNYFLYILNDKQKLTIEDGRQFLRRSTGKYDAVIMDAYTQGRYGASIPPQLVTKEFFQIVRDHLNPNGIVAYNVITTLRDYNADIVGAMYRTMKEVFPQVYRFESKESLNDVLIATVSPDKMDIATLRKKAADLIASKKIALPDYMVRVESFVGTLPDNYANSPILTDDFAPVEGLIGAGSGAGSKPAPAAPAK